MAMIQTDRLRLRRFEAGDAQDLFAYLHRPGASCFLSMKLDDISAARLEAVERSTSEEILAIEHRASGRVIGEVAAHRDPPDTVSVAWQLNAAFSRQGFALEAARALFGHLFTQEEVRRVYAYVEVGNASSQRLCERLGMRLEGVFKEFISFETDEAGAPIYVDTQQFALLRNEWRDSTA